MLVRVLLLLFTCFAFSECTIVKYEDCGSKLGKVNQVEVFPCSDPSDCILKKGSSYTINATFTTDSEVDKIQAVVHGFVGGFWVIYPFKQSDACKTSVSGLKCPVSKGSTVTYTATLPVSHLYPSIRLVVKWELQMEGKDIICFALPVTIEG